MQCILSNKGSCKIRRLFQNCDVSPTFTILEYGGLGLDFTYSVAVAEELGNINCGAIPMAIGVQTDMATPALARFASDQIKKDWLAPTIAGDMVVCLGVSEPSAGSDVASKRTYEIDFID